MQHTICEAHVRIAALRVDTLRGLLSLATVGISCDPIQSQLAEAENLLRRRVAAYAACVQNCADACALFDVAPTEVARSVAGLTDRSPCCAGPIAVPSEPCEGRAASFTAAAG